MQSVLMEKLRAYILINNPDLAVKLQEGYFMTQYVEDKIASVMPMVSELIGEGKPAYIVEELVMNELTKSLRPSRFHYIRNVIEEDFPKDYERLQNLGVLTYEIIGLVESCKEIFSSYDFTEDTEDNRFLKYAIIAAVHDHLV